MNNPRGDSLRASVRSGVLDSSRMPRDLTPDGVSFTVAARYQRHEKIADGGSGTLYRAIDVETGNEVALKCFHLHRAFDAALLPTLREAQRLANQVGPKVLVPLLDVGSDEDGTPYATMPLLHGETLTTRLTRALSVAEASVIETSLAYSVEALRQAGFTHGDLSAENVFVLLEGGVVLLDHESLGRIGTPRPQRHTEGVPELARGLREATDDERALAQLKVSLRRPRPISTQGRWILALLLVALVVILSLLAVR